VFVCDHVCSCAIVCASASAIHEVTCESMPSDDEYVLVVAICPWIIIFSLMTSIGTHATEPHTCAPIPAAKLPRSLCGDASCTRRATREFESRGECQNAVVLNSVVVVTMATIENNQLACVIDALLFVCTLVKARHC
jgi:hypothetical protein